AVALVAVVEPPRPASFVVGGRPRESQWVHMADAHGHLLTIDVRDGLANLAYESVVVEGALVCSRTLRLTRLEEDRVVAVASVESEFQGNARDTAFAEALTQLRRQLDAYGKDGLLIYTENMRNRAIGFGPSSTVRPPSHAADADADGAVGAS